MKRYVFRLESVLRARRVQEEMARQNMARANHAVMKATAVLVSEQERYVSVAGSTGLCENEEFMASRSMVDLVAASTVQARRNLEQISVAAAVRQASWREAAQRVSALERLDQRRREEHAVEVVRYEIATMDDMTTSRWATTSEAARPGDLQNSGSQS